MSKPRVNEAERKVVLLIDAVVWSDAYPKVHPKRDVYSWYARWLKDMAGVQLTYARAEDDLGSIRNQKLSGIILSGSPRDAFTEDPVNEKLCELVQACHKADVPFLGVCYGHQILARAFGGRVERHPQGLELGNTPVELTSAGERCPLFSGFSRQFDVLSSHADAVLELPEGAELLVKGSFTPAQGFQINQRLFGVQFHPESDPDTMRFLWSTRRDTWRSRVVFDLDKVLDQLQPTPMAANVLRNFVMHIAV